MNAHRAVLVSCLAAALALPILPWLAQGAPIAPPTAPPIATATAPATGSEAGTRATPDQAGGRRELATAGYAATAGSRFHYDLELDVAIALGKTDAGAEAAGEPAFAVAASGSLAMVVLGRRDDALLVGYRPDGLLLAPPAGAAAATAQWVADLQTAVRRGFDVRMDPQGRPTAMRFRGEWNPDQRNFARTLLRACSAEFRPAGPFACAYDDAMGHHTFACRAVPAAGEVRVERTRIGFAPSGAEGDARADVRLRGAATATFAADRQWLAAVAVDDEVAWSLLEGSLRLGTSLHCTLRCTGADALAVQAEWDAGFVDVGGRDERATAGTDPMRAFWDERLHGLDTPAVLSRLRAFLASGQEPSREYHELLQMLAELVRRDPAEADRLARLVQSAQVTGQAAADVLAAIGMAGHGPAQVALAAVFENGLVDAGLRQAAVESMFQIERPGPALVDSLQRSLQAGRLDDLAGSAMLALGAFGGRAAGGTDGRPILAGLLDLEATARRDGQAGAFFEALGNAGDPGVVPLAERLLRAADPAERLRGITVLRRVDCPAATALLQAAARGDAAAEVRRQALQVIGEATAPWTRDVLIERAAAEADGDVRRVAYSALATRAGTDAVAREALQARLAGERDPELLAMLRSLLHPA